MSALSHARDGQGLHEKVEFLQKPESYREECDSVESLETHMSWVFLTNEHAWKLKKPVTNPYLDFSTIEKRHEDCLREIQLNRRLTKEIYLNVVPLTNSDGLQLNGSGDVVDWLVQMRRLPTGHSLDVLVVEGTLSEADILSAARILSNFYHSSPRIKFAADRYCERFQVTILENQIELREDVFESSQNLLERITNHQLSFLENHAELLRQRSLNVIDAHGDLRPEHIWLTDPPAIIDCLEFNRELRLMDPACELAFLALECDRLGATWIGDLFLKIYSEENNDSPPERLLNFYRQWHACTRAKLAIWHLQDNGIHDPNHWIRKAAHYLQLAESPQ